MTLTPPEAALVTPELAALSEQHIIRLKLRPFPVRFWRHYAGWRRVGFSRRESARNAWTLATLPWKRGWHA